MPTYEYACGRCGHTFEEFQSITSKPLRKCPKCGRSALKRLVGGGAGLIFRGSGFYLTDYKKKPAAKEGSPGDSKPKTGDGATAKPAAAAGKQAK